MHQAFEWQSSPKRLFGARFHWFSGPREWTPARPTGHGVSRCFTQSNDAEWWCPRVLFTKQRHFHAMIHVLFILWSPLPKACGLQILTMISLHQDFGLSFPPVSSWHSSDLFCSGALVSVALAIVNVVNGPDSCQSRFDPNLGESCSYVFTLPSHPQQIIVII